MLWKERDLLMKNRGLRIMVLEVGRQEAGGRRQEAGEGRREKGEGRQK
jgi:hypothetical protein